MKLNYFGQGPGRQNYMTILIVIFIMTVTDIYECHHVGENIHLWPHVAAKEAGMFGIWGVT